MSHVHFILETELVCRGANTVSAVVLCNASLLFALSSQKLLVLCLASDRNDQWKSVLHVYILSCLSLPFVSSAHTGMHHAAYASVLSSLSTPDLQRTFCIASSPIRDPPPAAAPYSFEPVRPFTASASTHGELSTPSWFPIWVEHSSLRSISLLHTDASDNNNKFWTHWPR